jgi:hypothetical protein
MKDKDNSNNLGAFKSAAKKRLTLGLTGEIGGTA